ncbi:hypothetical protein PF008_g3838 [Phytophthora fragariae]|uniref:Uncharacterized protein n=1 Tax=Phytophthora fragariae TaxID=53985 RepID=A0A6G0SD93_9STRA|nr:hypothetical protein PF008_g3838 [Phytophthora fragariae]
MAARHDHRRECNRPVRNALLKWQLQQDQRRLVEVQKRLMRMAAPSPSSSLGLDSSEYLDRPRPRPSARRTRPLHHHDPEEDALMHLIRQREEREAATSNQHNERPPIGLKPSRIPYPAPFRRPEEHPKPPAHSSAKDVILRPTGQRLNAAGDFYSPVRPRESPLSSSTSEFRQNLAFSRIKASTPKRLVGAPSPRNQLRYDQMKTPDRWRTTAMHSNQEEFNESALRRWEEEDALRADRLLEKAARDGDSEALWNDLFYGTKAARAKTNQQPEQPVVYSSSSFPEVFSRSRANSHDSSCYETRDDFPKCPHKTDFCDDGMLPSELSTMTMSEQTKPSTTQHSDIGSRVADSDGASPPTSTQTISEMLASMDKVFQAEPSAGDLVAGGYDHNDGSSGGDDKEPLSKVKDFVSDLLVRSVSSSAELPRWSVIVVASCVLVGTCGFLMEELMGLLGIFSKNSTFKLSRAEQDRMRDRVAELQQELQGFQSTTSDIEVKFQTVLTDLQRHMDRMRLDRERHQDMLTGEMQELRRHILGVTHELVERERESIQAQLKEIVEIHVMNELEANDRKAIAGSEADSEEEAVVKAPVIIEVDTAMHESAAVSTPGTSSDSEPARAVNYAQDREKQPDIEPNKGPVVAPARPAVEQSVHVPAMQTSVKFNSAQAEATQNDAVLDQEQVVTPPLPIAQELETNRIEAEAVPDVDIDLKNAQEIVATPKQEGARHDILVKPTPKASFIAKPPRSTSGMSWEGILLLIGIMFLAACVVLRVYNLNRRKRWFEERRKRRNQRALLLAQQRARAMAEHQQDSDEWDDEDTDGDVEEVSLMTPVRDSEDDEAKSEVHQSPDIDTDDNQSEEASYTPPETYQPTTSERITGTSSKRSFSRGSPLILRHRRQNTIQQYMH